MWPNDTEPDPDVFVSSSSSSDPPAADRRPDSERPLDSLQLALNSVLEIAWGRGVWSE